jgi:hypothetical protein
MKRIVWIANELFALTVVAALYVFVLTRGRILR